MKKRIVSLLMVALMCVSLLPAAWAEGEEENSLPQGEIGVAEGENTQPEDKNTDNSVSEEPLPENGEEQLPEDVVISPQEEEVFRVLIPDYMKDVVTYDLEKTDDPNYYGGGIYQLTVYVKKGAPEIWERAYHDNEHVVNGQIYIDLEFEPPAGVTYYQLYGGIDLEDSVRKNCIEGGIDGGYQGRPGHNCVMATVNEPHNSDYASIIGSGRRGTEYYVVAWPNNENGENPTVAKAEITVEVADDFDVIKVPAIKRVNPSEDRVIFLDKKTQCDFDYDEVTGIATCGARGPDTNPKIEDCIKNGRAWCFLEVKAPDGYHAKEWLAPSRRGPIKYNGNEDHMVLEIIIDDQELTLAGVLGLTYFLQWEDDKGNICEEKLVFMVTGRTPFMYEFADPIEVRLNSHGQGLVENGITFDYDSATGYYHVSFDREKVPSVDALRTNIMFIAPDHANGYKENSGSGMLDYSDRRMVDELKNIFGYAEVKSVPDTKILEFPLICLAEQRVGDATYYYNSEQGMRDVTILWYDNNQNQTQVDHNGNSGENARGSYIYGRVDPFIWETAADSVSSLDQNEKVEKPTVVGEEKGKLHCNFFLQDTQKETKGAYYFQLEWKKSGGGASVEKKVVYLPYSFMGEGMTYERAQALKLKKPRIEHYERDNETLKETITGEFTPNGIRFEVSSFSPFVLNWEQESTAPNPPSGGSSGGSSDDSGSSAISNDTAKSAHGTVSFSATSAKAGSTVKVIAKPDAGYVVDTITVKTVSGKTVPVTENKDGTYSFTMPGERVKVEATFKPAETETPSKTPVELPFTDVAADGWAYEGIAYVYENNLFRGTSETTFSPKDNMTREQMWMVLARMDGKDPAVMDAARAWAVEHNISDGTNGKADVTREQFITLLWRFAGSPVPTADLSGYSDYGTVADYAKEAMGWAVSQGIVNGTSKTTLGPSATATREQVAVILARYHAA